MTFLGKILGLGNNAAKRRAQQHNRQYALLMFKPDALSNGVTKDGVDVLSSRLAALGVKHRILSPTLLFPTESFLNRFYDAHVNKDWFPEFILKYMLAAHSKRAFPQAPMLAFVLEGKVDQERHPGKSLYDILRMDSVIGPTYPEETVTAGKAKLADVVQSVRYQAKIEQGGTYNLPSEHKDRFNILHCSDGEAAAAKEISTVFAARDLRGLGVADYLMEELETNHKAPPAATSFALRELIEKDPDQAATEITGAYTDDYQPGDFSAQDASLLVRDWAEIMGRPIATRKSLMPGAKPVAIIAPSGCGKSTVVNQIMKNNTLFEGEDANPFVLVPVYSDRADAGGTGEVRLSGAEFGAWLHQGKFAAVESAYGVRYGVTKASLEDAKARGGVALLVCGPEIAESLGTYTIYLRPARDEAGAKQVLHERLERREPETGRPADERIEGAMEVFKFLEAKHDSFSAVVFNQAYSVSAVAEKIKDAITDIIDNGTPRQSLGVSIDQASRNNKGQERIADRPRAHRARSLLSFLLTNLLKTPVDVSSIDVSSFESIIATLLENDLNLNTLKHLLREAARISIGRHPMTAAEVNELEVAAQHTLEVFAAALQVTNLPQHFVFKGGGLGSLSCITNRKREEGNLRRIEKIATSIPPKERLLLALAHDSGKPREVAQLYLHDLNSYSFITKSRFFQDFEFQALNEENKADVARSITEIAIKYHHIIGGIIEGGNSVEAILDMLNDPQVLAVIAPDGNTVNATKAKALFDRILFLTIIDVGAHGYLSNLRVETYFAARDMVMNTIREKNGDLDEIFEAIGGRQSEWFETRMAAIAAPLDVIGGQEKMDVYTQDVSGLRSTYFDEVAKPSLDEAVAAGAFTAGERSFLESNLNRVTFFYFSMCRLARDERNTEENIEAGEIKMHPSTFKYMVALTNLLYTLDQDKGHQESMLGVMLLDKNNRLILGAENSERAAQEIRTVMENADTALENIREQRDGSRIADLANSNGAIEIITENDTAVEGRVLARVRLNNFESKA